MPGGRGRIAFDGREFAIAEIIIGPTIANELLRLAIPLAAVDHGGDFSTYYAHLSSFRVTAGQTVQVGEPIGAVGATGRATSPHLHFETRLAGDPVDPVPYLRVLN